MKAYQSKKWLYQKYINERLSIYKIAKLQNMKPNSILYWLQKQEIPRRQKTENRHIELYRNKNWLYQKYWIEEVSVFEMAKTCGINSACIYNWMKKHEIKTRSISEARKRNWGNPEYRENQIKKRKEAAKNPEVRIHLKKISKLNWNDPQRKEAMLAKMRIYKRTDVHKKRMSEILIGRMFSSEHIKNISIAQKKRMQNPQEKKRMREIRFIATKKRPTNPERIFDELTPSIIYYVGNGTWWRNLSNGTHKNPDFKIKGQNKVIEIFGDYWHRNDDPQELIDLYKQAGIDCLVIWEHEIYKQPEMILKKANNFIKEGNNVFI